MSKSLIKRRSLLRALGGASFLAAPVFRATLAEAQGAPLRLIILYFPGGAMMTKGGQGMWDFNQQLAPLASLQSESILFQNIVDPVGPEGYDLGHGGERSGLTGDGRGQMEVGGFTPKDLTSIDQVVANSIGKNTKFGSLQFGAGSDDPPEDGGIPGLVIWNKGVGIQAVADPATMFSRIFAGFTAPTPGTVPTTTASVDQSALAHEQALIAQRQSVLDLLKGQIGTLEGIVGSSEKLRLEEHLNGLRELEKSIMMPSGGGGGTGTPSVSCAAPSLTAGMKEDIPWATAAMSDLLYQSINCDLTRVASLQILQSGSTRYLPWLGTGEKGHHDMQHAPGPDFVKAQNWIVGQLAAIITRLKATPEGAGSMLDNSLVVLTSEMGDGEIHMNHPVPVLLAGKAGGQVRTGRNFDAAMKTRADLWVSVAKIMGAPITTLGDPAWNTGTISLS